VPQGLWRTQACRETRSYIGCVASRIQDHELFVSFTTPVHVKHQGRMGCTQPNRNIQQQGIFFETAKTPYTLQPAIWYRYTAVLLVYTTVKSMEYSTVAHTLRAFTYAQAKNLVRSSKQVSSLAAEISTQLQGIRPALWLDIFRLCCSVAALNFGQVRHSRLFLTYLAHTPTTKGATVKALNCPPMIVYIFLLYLILGHP
jgi:hypothetical protein